MARVDEHKNKHSSQYSAEQKRAWAHLIENLHSLQESDFSSPHQPQSPVKNTASITTASVCRTLQCFQPSLSLCLDQTRKRLFLGVRTMSYMNVSVHDLHHCTKLQLSTRCSFGVMTQTRHKFSEWEKC